MLSTAYFSKNDPVALESALYEICKHSFMMNIKPDLSILNLPKFKICFTL